jgi:hypothetical protein
VNVAGDATSGIVAGPCSCGRTSTVRPRKHLICCVRPVAVVVVNDGGHTAEMGEEENCTTNRGREKVREGIVTRATRDLPETRRCDDATIQMRR